MNNKKGFTLIEIICVIILITVVSVGVTVVVIKNNNEKVANILENNSSKFQDALEVYLSTHKEVINNVNENAKGAIVTLEVLKNEGLIEDNLEINYKKNYYLLSNAIIDVQAKTNIDCDSNQVSLAMIESWNVDTDKVVYICPKDSSTSTTVTIEGLQSQIDSLKNNN